MKHLALAAALAAPLLLASPAQARLAPGEAPGPYHKWFESQIVPDGTGRSCCSESDGYVLSDDDWRIAGGEYEVRVGGAWVAFLNNGEGRPGNTVLGSVSNPTGHAVAWYMRLADHVYPLCFAPGTVS